MISRTSPFWQKNQPRRAIQARTCDGSEWNWNGPGLIVGSSVQDDRRLRRHDVEDVHPPGRALDDLVAAVAPGGDVVRDDRR